MKKYLIFSALVLAAINSNQSIDAHTFSMKNESGKKLLVQVELLGDTTPYFQIAEVNASVQFSWPFPSIESAYCLNNIKCVVLDENFLNDIKKNRLLVEEATIRHYNMSVADLKYDYQKKPLLLRHQGQARGLVNFLERNERYRKLVTMKKDDEIKKGGFCWSYNFIIKSEGDNLVATYTRDTNNVADWMVNKLRN